MLEVNENVLPWEQYENVGWAWRLEGLEGDPPSQVRYVGEEGDSWVFQRTGETLKLGLGGAAGDSIMGVHRGTGEIAHRYKSEECAWTIWVYVPQYKD